MKAKTSTTHAKKAGIVKIVVRAKPKQGLLAELKAKKKVLTGLKAKKEALERGERVAARVFKFETLPDGSVRRVEVNPETHRRKVAKEWKAKTEVARARQTLNLTQDAFAGLLGISLSTLRSWEQGKREPSGAARTLVHIALKHPEVLQEEVAR